MVGADVRGGLAMEDSLSFMVSGSEVIVPVAFGALLVAFIAMLVRGMRLSRELERSRQVADEDRKSGQAFAAELKESIRSLQRESRELSELNFKLPSLMKQLTVDLERRSLGPLILKVLDQIFTPAQALVFFADDPGEKLTLVAAKGLDEGPLHPGAHIKVGDGRVGFAARKQICMGPRDFRLESNLNREQIQKTEPIGLRSDLCAPLVSNGRLLGAISMGLPRGWASVEVKRLFGMVGDVGALALASNLQYRKIQQLANSDPLTGISNKGYFMSKSARILRDAERFNRKAAVIILDVDHFKLFNDSYGHLAGDRVLRGIGDILKEIVREGDVAARFGGEEFVVLLTEADETSALQVAERIRAAVAECRFKGLITDGAKNVTVSAGVAVFPEDGVQLDDLIERADVTLYRAKESGRNQVLSYQEDRGLPPEKEPRAEAPEAAEPAAESRQEAEAMLEDAWPQMEESEPDGAAPEEGPDLPRLSEASPFAYAALPGLASPDEEPEEEWAPPPLPPILGLHDVGKRASSTGRGEESRRADAEDDGRPGERHDGESELTASTSQEVR
jgi:two-component system cell cycle response regulator